VPWNLVIIPFPAHSKRISSNLRALNATWNIPTIPKSMITKFHMTHLLLNICSWMSDRELKLNNQNAN
jgi:hypothetical protein